MHYDDEALFQLAEGSSPIDTDVASHVAECDECAAAVDEQRQFTEMLKDEIVWIRPSSPPPPMAGEMARLSSRLEAEERDAAKQLDDLLKGPTAWWATRVNQQASLRTAGGVRQLLARMRPMLQRSPADALAVTRIAVDLAEEIGVSEYPFDFVISIRAHAWRDHSYVLSYLGRMLEARDAADEAERLFAQSPLPEYELARVGLVRASILAATDHVAEAIALAQQSSDTFLEFGDRKRYINARVTQAAMIYEHGSPREALEIWSSLLDDSEMEDLTRVMVLNNIGMCHRDLGNIEKAIEAIRTALAEYEILGTDSLKAKSRWTLAKTLVMAERIDDAIPLLDQAWKELEALQMEGDAALVALELAEALIVTGRPERVATICRTLLDRFTRAGMTSRAITALAFLREAVAVGQAKPTLIRHVHDFLQELPQQPSRVFGPQAVARFDD